MTHVTIETGLQEGDKIFLRPPKGVTRQDFSGKKSGDDATGERNGD